MILKSKKNIANSGIYRMDSKVFKSIRLKISNDLYLDVSNKIVMEIYNSISHHEVE
jgi:NDP-sugar pyrophosphorylase family protein